MVTVRKPDVTRYRDANGKHCRSWLTDNPPEGGSTDIWHFRFTYRKKRLDISTGCRNEKRAERAANTLPDLVESYRCGEYIEVSEIRSDAAQDMFLAFLKKIGKKGEYAMAQVRDKSWEEFLTGYLESLTAKGKTTKYIKGRNRDVMRVAVYCEWKILRDLEQLQKVNGCLVELSNQGLSARTVNEVVRALKGFGYFLSENSYLADNPFKNLKTIEEVSKNPRRILNEIEFDTLLETAKLSKKTIHGLTGPTRLVIYLIAWSTGLRCKELASLTPENFTFDDRPRVWVAGQHTKNRKDMSQPLGLEMVALMERWLKGKSKGEKLFPGGWYRRGSEVIQVDLGDAGIEFKTTEGKFDFHCLRHQHSTSVMIASPTERTAREVTRHSGQAVQDRYAHIHDDDKRKVIDAMTVPKALRDELDA